MKGESEIDLICLDLQNFTLGIGEAHTQRARERLVGTIGTTWRGCFILKLNLNSFFILFFILHFNF